MDTDKIQKWIKDQSFLAIFITSWMIINWDIIILLFFGQEKLQLLRKAMFISDSNIILNCFFEYDLFSSNQQISWLLIYDIGLPFLLTAIRMIGIKWLALWFEDKSKIQEQKFEGEFEKLKNNLIAEFYSTINKINLNLINSEYCNIIRQEIQSFKAKYPEKK